MIPTRRDWASIGIRSIRERLIAASLLELVSLHAVHGLTVDWKTIVAPGFERIEVEHVTHKLLFARVFALSPVERALMPYGAQVVRA